MKIYILQLTLIMSHLQMYPICLNKDLSPILNKNNINECVYKNIEMNRNLIKSLQVEKDCKINDKCFGCCAFKKCLSLNKCLYAMKRKKEQVVNYIICFVFFTGFFFAFLAFFINLSIERIKFLSELSLEKNPVFLEINLGKITSLTVTEKSLNDFRKSNLEDDLCQKKRYSLFLKNINKICKNKKFKRTF
jgi:hypothetical protein